MTAEIVEPTKRRLRRYEDARAAWREIRSRRPNDSRGSLQNPLPFGPFYADRKTQAAHELWLVKHYANVNRKDAN